MLRNLHKIVCSAFFGVCNTICFCAACQTGSQLRVNRKATCRHLKQAVQQALRAMMTCSSKAGDLHAAKN